MSEKSSQPKTLQQPITPLDEAIKRGLYFADTYGLFIFPIPPNKKFTTQKWHDLSNNTTDKIRKAFGTKNKNLNIGIDLSKYAEADYRLFALDFDVEKDEDGNLIKSSTKHIAQFKDIIRRFDIPRTLTTQSASGGFHIILKVKENVFKSMGLRNYAKKDIQSYDRLDIITGNVVAPTSVITNSIHGKYTFLDSSQISESPMDLLIFLQGQFNSQGSAAAEQYKNLNEPFDVDEAEAKELCIQYIVNQAPIAQTGKNGDNTTYNVSNHLWDLTANVETIKFAMTLYNNTKCNPMWDPDSIEFKKFLRPPHQRAHRQNEPGERGPRKFTDFPRYEPIVNQFGLVTIKRNDMYNVVLSRANAQDRGKCREYSEIPQKLLMVKTSFDIRGNFIDHDLKKSSLGTYKLCSHFITNLQAQTNYDYINFEDTKTKKGAKLKNVIQYLNRRKLFNEVDAKEFMPQFEEDLVHNGVYNIYEGLEIETSLQLEEVMVPDYVPKSPQAQLIHDRFFEIISYWANKDEDLQGWLTCWIAKRIQCPSWKPQTSIVIQGQYGSGKSIVFNTLKMIMGTKLLHILGHAELEDGFNSIEHNSLLTVYDEIDSITDDKIIKRLDSKIGNKSGVINEKFESKQDVTTYTGVVITCNEIPQTLIKPNQRRYQICFMSNKHAQDKKYFKPLFFTNDSEKVGNLTKEEIEGLSLIYKTLKTMKLNHNVDMLTFNADTLRKSIENFNFTTHGVSSWFITRVLQGEFNKYTLSETTPIEIAIAPLWDDYALYCEAEDLDAAFDFQQFALYIRNSKLYGLKKVMTRGKRPVHQKRSINYQDRTQKMHAQPYAYTMASREDLIDNVLNALGSSIIKNTTNGAAILTEFLEKEMSTPPYSELLESADDDAAAEFDAFVE